MTATPPDAPAPPAPADAPGASRAWRWTWRHSAVWLAVWTVMGAFFATRQSAISLAMGKDLPPLKDQWLTFADAYLWALFTPVILWMAWRFPFRRGAWARPLLLHALAAVALTLLSVGFNVVLAYFVYPDDPPVFRVYLARVFHYDVQWYVMVAGAGWALEWYRRYRDREVRAAHLETQLARAQLQALKMQIQPHFLFNTLHAITELVHEDVEAADRMITRLGDLLRLTVDSAGTPEVTLRQEMDFLEAYLEIEQTRYQDRLTVRTTLEDGTLDALVPNLILQPLVENAIRHGTAPLGRPGSIHVSSRHEGTALVLEVSDDGAGLSAVPPTREGVGLANTRARLLQLYGAAQRLDLRPGDGGGAVAEVRLPFRTATKGAPAVRAAEPAAVEAR